MKPDIWMPWYPGDYQRATQHLTTLEHGAYRLLIDACWCRGGNLPNDDGDLARIVHLQPDEWSKIRPRMAEFFQTDNGAWTHKRVTEELDKAKDRKDQQFKRTEAARAALQSHRNTVTKSVTDIVTTSSSPSPSPSVQEGRKEGGFPSLEEVKVRAGMTGMLETDAIAFWNHFESSGWIDKHGHPIVKWQSKMDNWKSEARAMPAEANHRSFESGQRPKSSNDLRIIIQAKESLAAGIRTRYCSDGAISSHWSDENRKAEFFQLKREAKELTKQLSNMA